ncbi:MAG: hypothetical protein SGJ18_09960 [Pseudomonadota bacterium]|nr:hypothetical protein [Pseudomonadota bacterium]
MKQLFVAFLMVFFNSSVLFADQPPLTPKDLRIENGFAGRSYELVAQINQLKAQFSLTDIQGEVLALLRRSYSKTVDQKAEVIDLWNDLFVTLNTRISELASSEKPEIDSMNEDLESNESELLAQVLVAEKKDSEKLKQLLKEILGSEKYQETFFNDLIRS